MSTKSSASSKKPAATDTKQQQVSQKLKVWNQCPSCRLVIQKFTNDDHVCSTDNDATESGDQSFLFDGQLTGASLIEHDKDLIKDLPIDKDLLFDFAFLNSQTTSLANLKIGDYVWITPGLGQGHGSFTAVCWPMTNGVVDQSHVALSKQYLAFNGLKPGSATSVVRRIDESSIKTASLVVLELNESLSSNQLDLFAETQEATRESELVIDFLRQRYQGKCILESQSLYLNYMGQKVVFSIKSIQAVKTSTSDAKKKSSKISAAVDAALSQLTITDSTAGKNKATFVETGIKPPVSLPSSAANCPPPVFRIDGKTKFVVDREVESSEQSSEQLPKHSFSFKNVGGLEKELDLLRELFILPFEFESIYKEIANYLGVDFSKGVLLYGPSGCGKTLVAKTICHLSKANVVELNISQVFSKNYGESESRLKKIFQEAWEKSPCILLIDDIDNLCSRREAMNQDLEKRIVSLFTNLMDQSKSKGILFLCTTSKIDTIDLSLRRPGRLDKEIEIPIPNQTARYSILKSRLDMIKSQLDHEDLVEISQNCHGYVGADLDMLVQEAGLVCVKRIIGQDGKDKDNELTAASSVSLADLRTAMHKVKPSAMREITFDIPKVYWNQIGGQHDLKKKLHQAIIWPIKYADAFKRINVKAPRGLLMYGPPGCSKTMIAKALATETGLNFIAVKGPELFSKWVGESERTVREIFRKARNAAPAIIFFDEIDAIAVERSSGGNKSNNVGDRVLAQLLNEMDGVENLTDVTVVAATNRPDMIDKALMRPGRLDRIVYVKLPDEATRREIFELKFRQMPVADDIDLDVLVKSTARYSGAEIAAVCNEAGFLALDSDINCTVVSMKDLTEALQLVTPRTSDDTIKYFDGFSFNSGLSEI